MRFCNAGPGAVSTILSIWGIPKTHRNQSRPWSKSWFNHFHKPCSPLIIMKWPNYTKFLSCWPPHLVEFYICFRCCAPVPFGSLLFLQFLNMGRDLLIGRFSSQRRQEDQRDPWSPASCQGARVREGSHCRSSKKVCAGAAGSRTESSPSQGGSSGRLDQRARHQVLRRSDGWRDYWISVCVGWWRQRGWCQGSGKGSCWSESSWGRSSTESHDGLG